MAPTSTKQFTICEKVKIIEASESLSERELANKFETSKTTIHRVLQQKEEILKLFNETGLNTERKRRYRSTPNEQVNVSVLKFYNDNRARGINLSGPLLKERAVQLARQYGIKGFKASDGWLCLFKKRNGISFKSSPSSNQLPSTSQASNPRSIEATDENNIVQNSQTVPLKKKLSKAPGYDSINDVINSRISLYRNYFSNNQSLNESQANDSSDEPFPEIIEGPPENEVKSELDETETVGQSRSNPNSVEARITNFAAARKSIQALIEYAPYCSRDLMNVLTQIESRQLSHQEEHCFLNSSNGIRE